MSKLLVVVVIKGMLPSYFKFCLFQNYVIPTMDNGAELSKKLFLSLQEIQVTTSF